jgi:hypothetical protein
MKMKDFEAQIYEVETSYSKETVCRVREVIFWKLRRGEKVNFISILNYVLAKSQSSQPANLPTNSVPVPMRFNPAKRKKLV